LFVLDEGPHTLVPPPSFGGIREFFFGILLSFPSSLRECFLVNGERSSFAFGLFSFFFPAVLRVPPPPPPPEHPQCSLLLEALF